MGCWLSGESVVKRCRNCLSEVYRHGHTSLWVHASGYGKMEGMSCFPGDTSRFALADPVVDGVLVILEERKR